jgi:glyoxylase-like metal-dependent hydrolase (beta-lactamase superfamily II)
MAKTDIVTIDLNFQNRTQAIASYLIRNGAGVVLIESGPGSTLAALEAGLAKEGLSPRDITHVLLTHIHLDHAGAAGWLAQQGAQIHVHPNGAPHLLDPEKLIASASRIYGDRMQELWGEILPVEQGQLKVVRDTEEVVIGRLRFTAISTPGHAEHHHAWLFEDLCFSGDAGGVRIPGYQYLRAPMPPPELHFGRWHESIARLRSLKFERIAPTHFGMYEDPQWQLNELEKNLLAVEKWLEEVMPSDPPVEQLREKFAAWMESQARAQGLSEAVLQAYIVANPVGMSADGLLRYWKKVRLANVANKP